MSQLTAARGTQCARQPGGGAGWVGGGAGWVPCPQNPAPSFAGLPWQPVESERVTFPRVLARGGGGGWGEGGGREGGGEEGGGGVTLEGPGSFKKQRDSTLSTHGHTD